MEITNAMIETTTETTSFMGKEGSSFSRYIATVEPRYLCGDSRDKPYRTSATHAEYGGSITLSVDVTPRNDASLAASVFTLFPAPPNFDTSSDTVFACPLILIATTTGAAPAGAVRTYASTLSSPASSISNPPSCSAGLVLRSAINCLYQFSSESGFALSVSTLIVL